MKSTTHLLKSSTYLANDFTKSSNKHTKTISLHKLLMKKLTIEESDPPCLAPRLLSPELYETENTGIKESLFIAEEKYNTGCYEAAIIAYKRVMQNDSLCNIAVVNISAAMLMKEMYKSALEILKTICLKRQEYFAGTYNKILALIRLKKCKSAYKLIESIFPLGDSFDQSSLQKLKKMCELSLGAYSNPKRKTRKETKPKVSANLQVPYLPSCDNPAESKLQTQSSLKKYEKSSTLLHKDSIIFKTFSTSRTMPKPLQTVSEAYSNFMHISRKDKKRAATKRVTKPLLVTSPKQLRQEELLTSSLTFSKIPKFNAQDSLVLNSEGNINLPDERKITESLISPSITTQAINEICFEYFKPQPLRNNYRLASRLSKLNFFSKFSDRIIVEIVKRSSLICYGPGDTIIHQGDEGDYMYVILSGTVTIMKKSEEFGNLDVQINSLYQGDTFGEMALLASGRNPKHDDSVKRSASCISDQKTLVIAVSKEDYKCILLEMMHNDIHGKAAFFSSLILFHGTDDYNLIPLSANIEPLVFKINEIIIESGELPQGLYIIYEGRCSVIWEGYLLRKRSELSKVLSQAPKGFLSDRVPQEYKSLKPKISTTHIDMYDSQEISRAQKFLKTEKITELMKDYHLYKKAIELHKIKVGDFFGSRAILNDENKVTAKFSVIADSSEVKIFLLRSKHFALLPESCLVWDM